MNEEKGEAFELGSIERKSSRERDRKRKQFLNDKHMEILSKKRAVRHA